MVGHCRHFGLFCLTLVLCGCTFTAPGPPNPPPPSPVATPPDPVTQASSPVVTAPEPGSPTAPGSSVVPTPPAAHPGELPPDTRPASDAGPKPDPLAEPSRGVVDYDLSRESKIRVLAAEGVMPSVKRTVQLLRLGAGQWQVVNEVNVPQLPGNTVTFWREDLPGYPGAIVMEASRGNGVRHGAVAVVEGRLVALDYYKLIAPEPERKQGAFLFLNKYMNEVWVYRDGNLIANFATANGRDPWGKQPTWQDYKTNYKTPEGLFPIKQKIVNPPYNNLGGNHPPAAPGAPNNPLGTRWIGLEVLPGDGGGVWGMHGTYVPEQIGTWASEGCIRLNTKDAEALYDLVPMGTLVRIISGI